MERYQHVVRGMYFGHTHYESFNVFKSSKNGNNIALSHTGSSLAPYAVYNPSFTVIEIDQSYMIPLNIRQVYYDVF